MPYVMKGKLTKRMEDFCQEFVNNNHHQAEAYLKVYKCKPNTASAAACKLMKNPLIIERIEQLEEEAWKRAAITPAKMLRELAKIAFADVDNDNGLTYSVKKDYFNLLQRQMGLDKQTIEAKVEVNNINIDIED